MEPFMSLEEDVDLSFLRILYVDDNDLNLRVISALLESRGITLTCAPSPTSALEILEKGSFHVLLLDIQMPDMNGVDLLAEIRRTPGANQSTPAIAVTADLTRDEAEYEERGF